MVPDGPEFTSTPFTSMPMRNAAAIPAPRLSPIIVGMNLTASNVLGVMSALSGLVKTWKPEYDPCTAHFRCSSSSTSFIRWRNVSP